MSTSSDPFTADDFKVLSGLAIETWQSGLDRDWSVAAGTLEWSCRTTAEHTVDAIFAPALNLASRRQHAYAHFDRLRGVARRDDRRPRRRPPRGHQHALVAHRHR